MAGRAERRPNRRTSDHDRAVRRGPGHALVLPHDWHRAAHPRRTESGADLVPDILAIQPSQEVRMNREQLEHALRAAASITGETTILVIGSQSILGSYSEDDLPAAATKSVEIDLGFFNDPDGYKADLIEGVIGEDSDFDQMYGYYVDGVDTGTATLPHGWWN